MGRPRAEQITYSLTLHAGRYCVKWWENGSAHRISCRTANLAAARRFLEEFKAGRAAGAVPESPTIGQVLDAYERERSTRPHSGSFPVTVRVLHNHLADVPVDLLTRDRLRQYMTDRRSDGRRDAAERWRRRNDPTGQPPPLKDVTLRHELAILRASFNWAVREGWFDRVPYIDLPPSSPPRQRWLTREEAQRLLDACVTRHMRLYVAMGLYTAARSGAILDLTWQRVSFDRGVIDFGNGQGNKRRAVVPMHPRLRPMLAEAFDARQTDFVIEYRGKRIKRMAGGFWQLTRRADMPDVHPHVLRHTAATWMAQKGVPIEQIAAYLGNSPAIVAKVYAHFTPDYMGAAMNALGD